VAVLIGNCPVTGCYHKHWIQNIGKGFLAISVGMVMGVAYYGQTNPTL
jgi:hypothetical protein